MKKYLKKFYKYCTFIAFAQVFKSQSSETIDATFKKKIAYKTPLVPGYQFRTVYI